MLGIIVVVAPIMFVLLTTVAILSFAPVEDEESDTEERVWNKESDEMFTQGEGAKVILFRPAALRDNADPSVDDIVAHLEQELRQRHQAAEELVAESDRDAAAAS